MGDRVGLRLGWGWIVGVGLLCLWISGAGPALWAYDAPPQRAARLSYLRGSVSVDHMDNSGNEPAQVNMPLVQGLLLKTGDDGQAEIEFEDGSLVRMTPNSSLSLDNLSVDGSGNFQTQIGLMRGLIYAELRAASKYTYRLYAGGDAVSPVENATVRIDLDETPAKIAVLAGRAHVERASAEENGGYRTDVRVGETLAADVTDFNRYFLTPQIVPDSWDDWNEERDQAAADQAANRTEARDNFAGDQGYGWSDLDANGSWYDVPGQGTVWQPAVAADPGFDPYGFGNWVWSPGAGYVWASGYGWGWTPYRCGNWSYWGGFGWGWMPGVNCGFGGWGFGGPVYVINIIRPPFGYHPHPFPPHGPGNSHPIVPVHPGRIASAPLQVAQGPRTIDGHVVEPLRPIGNTYTSRGGSVVGASLMRDFPVDRVNHQPVMGNTLVRLRVRHRPGVSGALVRTDRTPELSRRLRYPVSLRVRWLLLCRRHILRRASNTTPRRERSSPHLVRWHLRRLHGRRMRLRRVRCIRHLPRDRPIRLRLIQRRVRRLPLPGLGRG